jgi:hypothetical protein
MELKKNNKFTEEYKLIREILWKEKHLESGENVMIPGNAFIYPQYKKKRRMEQLDEFGNLIEDWPDDEYTCVQD